jgi:hypothetical protein
MFLGFRSDTWTLNVFKACFLLSRLYNWIFESWRKRHHMLLNVRIVVYLTSSCVNWASLAWVSQFKTSVLKAYECQKRPNLHTNELKTTFFCSTSPLKAPNRLKSFKLAWRFVFWSCDIYQNPFTQEKILKFWQCRTKNQVLSPISADSHLSIIITHFDWFSLMKLKNSNCSFIPI